MNKSLAPTMTARYFYSLHRTARTKENSDGVPPMIPRGAACALIALIAGTGSHAAQAPIEAFARAPVMDLISISPDGRYIAFVSGIENQRALIVVDRTGATKLRSVMTTGMAHSFDFSWCGWANNTRVMCGLIGTADANDEMRDTKTRAQYDFKYAITRLVAIDADGSNMKVLIQNSRAGWAQFQDRVLDWTPDDVENVLIALDDDADTFPSVFKLNVYSGSLRPHLGQEPPLSQFWTDAQGQVRLASGVVGTQISYFGRIQEDGKVQRKWRPLVQFTAFAQPEQMTPLAIKPSTNQAYVIGEKDGHRALWLADIEDHQPPQLVLAINGVDIGHPILSTHNRLLGVFYDTDRPNAHYTDERSKDVINRVGKLLPDTYNSIQDLTQDEKVYVIKASSDVDGGSYWILDLRTGAGDLERLGTAYPELSKIALGRMQSIRYPARDGAVIPGYLTVPPGIEAKDLPLIVMPHDGPRARDSWEFDFLRAFLVNRGYAVLQMNFRGSEGYGWEWFHAAHQDWGGLTYADITDGAKWAVAQGIADPKRMCILGWGFGGYAALLGAVRNSDLYKCSVSIAGITDLLDFRDEAIKFRSSGIVRLQLGSDRDKLGEDSPRRHAEKIATPILLVHGDRDARVDSGHSRKMAAALKSAGKSHEYIPMRQADSRLRWPSERVMLLEAVEKFLAQQIGPGVGAN
jgi:dipeptidyl aminopeptidase/acylaminoacyl peptidase